MERLVLFILAIWAMIGALVSVIVFVLTWVIIAAIFYGVWTVLESGQL